MNKQIGYALLTTMFLLACTGRKPTMEIHMIPQSISPNGTAELTLYLSNPPSERRFQWIATRGRFEPDSIDATPSRIYVAPASPGPDTLTVRMLQGSKVILEQSLAVNVGTVSNNGGSMQKMQGSGKPPVGAKFEVTDPIVPSGWMGDGENGTTYVQVDSSSTEDCHSRRACYKWTYKPGPRGWAAVAWQYPEGNWGDRPGKNMSGFSKVTFWARGQKGGERLMFEAGGHTNPSATYPASFEAQADPIELTASWREYTISLAGKDLSNTICFLDWVATARQNPDGLVFFMDDIYYEK